MVEKSNPGKKRKGKMVFYDHWEPEIACFGGKSGALAARSSLRELKLSFWRVEGRVRTPSATAQIDLS